MKEKINEQLALLQQELSRLKNVTDYIDNSKIKSESIINELGSIQKSYTQYTDKIFDLYELAIKQIKKDTDSYVKEGVGKLEAIGANIVKSNSEKLTNTKRFLEGYKTSVETSIDSVKKDTKAEIKKGVDQLKTASIQVEKSNIKQLDNTKTFLEEHKLSVETSIGEIKKDAKAEIKQSVDQLNATATKIDKSIHKQLNEIQKLLDKHKDLVEATDNLVQTLNAVDFPKRLDSIEKQMSTNSYDIKTRISKLDNDLDAKIAFEITNAISHITSSTNRINNNVNTLSNAVNGKIDEQVNKTNKMIGIAYAILIVSILTLLKVFLFN